METLAHGALNRNLPPSGIQLRDYQTATLDKIEAAKARGIRRQLIHLPTGAGKTILFAEAIRREGGRALVLAHRDELISQAVDKLRMVMPGADIGVVKAECNEVAATIVVASVQTLSRANRLAQLGRDFNIVVIDEAHHAAAATYQAVLAYLGVLNA